MSQPAIPEQPHSSTRLPLAGRPMRRLFRYLQSYRGRLLFACGSSVTNKILDMMPPLLVGWVIDSLRGAPPGWISNLAGTRDPWSMAVVLAGLSVAIFFFESLFEWLYQGAFRNLAQTVQHDLRMDAYGRIQSREIAFFEEHRLGEILSMLNDDVNQLERFLNTGFNELLQVSVLFVVSMVIMLPISWQLSLVALFPIPFILWGGITYQRLIAPRYTKVREGVGGLASRLENNIAGIHVIKSFTAEDFETDRVRQVSDAYRRANYDAIRLSALYIPVIRMAIVCGFAGVLLVGSYWVLQGRGVITAGELV